MHCFLRFFDEILSGFRDKFQNQVTFVAFSIEFAKTNQKIAENSEICENCSLLFIRVLTQELATQRPYDNRGETQEGVPRRQESRSTPQIRRPPSRTPRGRNTRSGQRRDLGKFRQNVARFRLYRHRSLQVDTRSAGFF